MHNGSIRDIQLKLRNAEEQYDKSVIKKNFLEKELEELIRKYDIEKSSGGSESGSRNGNGLYTGYTHKSTLDLVSEITKISSELDEQIKLSEGFWINVHDIKQQLKLPGMVEQEIKEEILSRHEKMKLNAVDYSNLPHPWHNMPYQGKRSSTISHPLGCAFSVKPNKLSDNNVSKILLLVAVDNDELKYNIEASVDNALELAASSKEKHIAFPLLCGGMGQKYFANFSGDMKNLLTRSGTIGVKQVIAENIIKTAINKNLILFPQISTLHFVDYDDDSFSKAWEHIKSLPEYNKLDFNIVIGKGDLSTYYQNKEEGAICCVMKSSGNTSHINVTRMMMNKAGYSGDHLIIQYSDREVPNYKVGLPTNNIIKKVAQTKSLPTKEKMLFSASASTSSSMDKMNTWFSCLDHKGDALQGERQKNSVPNGSAYCNRLTESQANGKLDNIQYLIHAATASWEQEDEYKKDIQIDDIRNTVANIVKLAYEQKISNVLMPLLCGGIFSNRVNLDSDDILGDIATIILNTTLESMERYADSGHKVNFNFVDYDKNVQFKSAYDKLSYSDQSKIKVQNDNILKSGAKMDGSVAIVNPANSDLYFADGGGLTGLIVNKIGYSVAQEIEKSTRNAWAQTLTQNLEDKSSIKVNISKNLDEPGFHMKVAFNLELDDKLKELMKSKSTLVEEYLAKKINRICDAEITDNYSEDSDYDLDWGFYMSAMSIDATKGVAYLIGHRIPLKENVVNGENQNLSENMFVNEQDYKQVSKLLSRLQEEIPDIAGKLIIKQFKANQRNT